MAQPRTERLAHVDVAPAGIMTAWFNDLLAAARQLRGLPAAGWMLFGGVLAIALAVLIALDLPSSAAWAIGSLVGVDLIFWGTRTLVAASLLKRVVER